MPESRSKPSIKQITFVLTKSDGLAAETISSIYVNRTGLTARIIEVWGETDTGTISINLQRNDGSPANIMSSALSCSSSGATQTSFVAAESKLNNGDRLNLVTSSPASTPKRLTVNVTFVQ